MSAVICFCGLETAESIELAVRNGAKTYDDIIKKTRAGNGCQSCYFEVQTLLEITTAKMKDEEKRKSDQQIGLF